MELKKAGTPNTGDKRVLVNENDPSYRLLASAILVYEYNACPKFGVRFDYTWIIRVFPAPPGGPK